MNKPSMNLLTQKQSRLRRQVKAVFALALMSVSLAGCVVYPDGGYAGGGGYYAPRYYAPPVAFGFGFGGYGHHHDDDD